MKSETSNGVVFELKKGQAVMQDKSNLITLFRYIRDVAQLERQICLNLI